MINVIILLFGAIAIIITWALQLRALYALYIQSQQNRLFMSTLEDLQALVSRLQNASAQTSASLQNIATDIQEIKNNLPAPGPISQDQLDALAAQLTAVANSADALAAAAAALDAENPAPNAEPAEG